MGPRRRDRVWRLSPLWVARVNRLVRPSRVFQVEREFERLDRRLESIGRAVLAAQRELELWRDELEAAGMMVAELEAIACSREDVDESAGLAEELEPGRTEAEYRRDLLAERSPEPPDERAEPWAREGDVEGGAGRWL